MENSFTRVLARYGLEARVFPDGEEPGFRALALLQPIRERGRQNAPSPLGWGKREEWLYLGQEDVPLEVGEKGFVRIEGREYEVFSARKVSLGRWGSHWQAILKPREESR